MPTVFTDFNPKSATPGVTAHKVTLVNGSRRVTFQATVGDIFIRHTGEAEGVGFADTDDAAKVPKDGSFEMLLDRKMHGNPPSFWIEGSSAGAKVRIIPKVR